VQTNTEAPPPPTDKTILGRYWMFADLDDLKATVRYIQFEIDTQESRNANTQALKDLSAARRREIEEALASVEVFDVEKTGL
jgi:D-mannonate dehydratase